VIKSKLEDFITYRLEIEFSLNILILLVCGVQTHIGSVRGEVLSRASGEEFSFIL